MASSPSEHEIQQRIRLGCGRGPERLWPTSLKWTLRRRLAPISKPTIRLLRSQSPWLAPAMAALLQTVIQHWLPSVLKRSARSTAVCSHCPRPLVRN
jgi:hypothetical protein